MRMKKPKWKKAESGGWTDIDVDANIWCPCDTELEDTLYCQNGHTVVCPRCGTEYRVITRVYIQEKIKEEDQIGG